MQKIIIKEIIPASADNKPTIITDPNGTKMSGFEGGLKTLKPGDIIEVELEVKGKFVNIKSYKLCEQAPSQKLGQVSGEDAIILALYKIAALATAVFGGAKPADTFVTADSFYDYLTGRKGRVVKPPASTQEWDELTRDEPIKNVGDLCTRAHDRGASPRDILAIAGVGTVSELSKMNLDEVWEAVEKKWPRKQ